MRIVTVLGARPQFIKAGTVSREVQRVKSRGIDISEVIIHTGQHYDSNMSDVFFKEMKIPKPNYSLGISGKNHGEMTGQMIQKIEEVLIAEKPDWVMVYGDTNSTLAGAIAAAKLNIKIAHVEAGLRSFNTRMPEEINRILTDRVSSILFCPTKTALGNLINEGVDHWRSGAKIINCGDVMYDGALFYRGLSVRPLFDLENQFILCTIHRAENTNDSKRLFDIFNSLREISLVKQVVMPLHPRTKSFLDLLKIDVGNIKIVPPQGYLSMVWLIDNCNLVLTDSGGLQKEAYFFEKPCITLRDETEWVELVESGANILVGNNIDDLVDLVNSDEGFINANFKCQHYGNGNSAEIIIDNLLKY